MECRRPHPIPPRPRRPHLRFALELELGALPERERPGWRSRSAPPGVVILRRASSRPPALGRTRAPHLPCLFTRHHLCPALPRASSFLSSAWLPWWTSSNFLYLGASFLPPHPVLPTAPAPRTPKQPTPPSGPHLWLCGKSAALGAGPGFAPSLSQVT